MHGQVYFYEMAILALSLLCMDKFINAEKKSRVDYLHLPRNKNKIHTPTFLVQIHFVIIFHT